MTALAAFCALTVVFLAARDVFVPHVRDVEVWFGFELHGALARWTAPLHWGIFALGAWAFWRAVPWIAPAAAGYVFYVALSHLVWSEASPNGNGWPIGLAQAAALSVPGFLLLRAHRLRARVSASIAVLALCSFGAEARADDAPCEGVTETIVEAGKVIREICHDTGGVTIPYIDAPIPQRAVDEAPRSVTRFELGELDGEELRCCCSPGEPIVRVPAEYPPEALQHGIEGFVALRGSITRDGRVADARLAVSSPPAIFAAAALKAFTSWRYTGEVHEGEEVVATLCFRRPRRLSASDTHVAVFVYPAEERGDPWSDVGFSGAIDHARSALHETSTCLGIAPERAQLHESERVAVEYGGRDFVFATSPTSGVAAVLISPDRPPREVEAPTGASSLILLLPDAAADYFDAPRCRRSP